MVRGSLTSVTAPSGGKGIVIVAWAKGVADVLASIEKLMVTIAREVSKVQAYGSAIVTTLLFPARGILVEALLLLLPMKSDAYADAVPVRTALAGKLGESVSVAMTLIVPLRLTVAVDAGDAQETSIAAISAKAAAERLFLDPVMGFLRSRRRTYSEPGKVTVVVKPFAGSGMSCDMSKKGIPVEEERTKSDTVIGTALDFAAIWYWKATVT